MRLREAIKRASLVPAAAVIPALIVYVRIVAVKKLVVETRFRKFCWIRKGRRVKLFVGFGSASGA